MTEDLALTNSLEKRIERVETPSHWTLLLKDSELERTELYNVTRKMVKNFKGFLKNEYSTIVEILIWKGRYLKSEILHG